jgi:hypothetical protein
MTDEPRGARPDGQRLQAPATTAKRVNHSRRPIDAAPVNSNGERSINPCMRMGGKGKSSLSPSMMGRNSLPPSTCKVLV